MRVMPHYMNYPAGRVKRLMGGEVARVAGGVQGVVAGGVHGVLHFLVTFSLTTRKTTSNSPPLQSTEYLW